VQSPDGKIYGLPTGVFGMGLHYNRDLFKAAGLDPDKPPTTWEDLRADAKAIHDKTGQPGFVLMSKGTTGGRNLTALTTAFGGRLESEDGKTATVNNDATKQVLTLVQQMRWQDNSMGSAALLDWGGINQAFAAGKVGMYVSGSDVYNALVQQNKVKADSYGLGLLPVASAPNAGLLGGGSIAAVSAKANRAQADAAVKWNDWYYMRKLAEQDAAVADAKTLNEGKQPVGTPQLPVFDVATLQQYDSWIKPYVNVPVDQMTAFTGGIGNQKLAQEPVTKTQELYAQLDSVVQKVLTDKNTDVNQVLDKANTQAQSLIAQ
jgi:ABC-type glycerol-3-phosphate transport system substrate-binding protein